MFNYLNPLTVKPNFKHLEVEINADATITRNCIGLSYANQIVTTHFDGPLLLQSHLNALAAVIAAHDPNSLAIQKDAKANAVDVRTVQLIEAGFTYGGKQFSLSASAQANWLGVLTANAAAGLSYPYPVAALDNDYHLALDNAEMVAMAGTALTHKGWAVGSGAALKMAIKDATTQAELDAVIDVR